MNLSKEDTSLEVEILSQNKIVPFILEMVCKVTGMGFAAIARVTEQQWIACAVRDEINFGLRVGGELKVDTTICHEIRQNGTEVVIDEVNEDDFYKSHHTPAMYGFQSYISVPIKRQDDRFFGTLCAIDPSPAILNTPEIVGIFKAFAALVSFHLNATEQLPAEKALGLQEHTAKAIIKELDNISSADLNANANPASGKPKSRSRSKHLNQMILESTQRINDLILHLKAQL